MTPLLLALLLTAARPAADQRAVDGEVALARAAALLDAGDAAGALEVVAHVDPAAVPGLRFRHAALEGRLLSAIGRAAEAAAPLREAKRIAEEAGAALDAPLELLLARAEEEAGDCGAALLALRRAGPVVFQTPEHVLVQARCHLALEEGAAALADLDAGLSASPPHAELRLLRARTLLSSGLVLAAAGDARALVAVADADRVVDLTAALEAAGAPRGVVLELLEVAAARFPEDARTRAALARALRTDAPGQAARLMSDASWSDESLAADAAELDRAAGGLAAALRANARSADVAARLRQRLAILVDAEAWDRALALAPRLRAAGLADAPVSYALAYASLQTGDAARADAFLDEVKDPAWFERATALRAAIVACSARSDGSEGVACAR